MARSDTKKHVQINASSPAQSSRAALLYSRIASSNALHASSTHFLDSAPSCSHKAAGSCPTAAASAVVTPPICSVKNDADATKTSQPAALNLASDIKWPSST